MADAKLIDECRVRESDPVAKIFWGVAPADAAFTE